MKRNNMQSTIEMSPGERTETPFSFPAFYSIPILIIIDLPLSLHSLYNRYHWRSREVSFSILSQPLVSLAQKEHEANVWTLILTKGNCVWCPKVSSPPRDIITTHSMNTMSTRLARNIFLTCMMQDFLSLRHSLMRVLLKRLIMRRVTSFLIRDILDSVDSSGVRLESSNDHHHRVIPCPLDCLNCHFDANDICLRFPAVSFHHHRQDSLHSSLTCNNQSVTLLPWSSFTASGLSSNGLTGTGIFPFTGEFSTGFWVAMITQLL